MPQCLPASPETNCGRISPDQIAENTNPDFIFVAYLVWFNPIRHRFSVTQPLA
jgi:hypothetical protein